MCSLFVGRFFGFPFCIPLVYSWGALCSFFINILLFTEKKNCQLKLFISFYLMEEFRLESLGSYDGLDFCLGSYVRKGINIDQLNIWPSKIPNGCYLHKGEEETVDHVFLHCSRIVILW